MPSLQATEINDVLGHSFALLVPKCSYGVADQENIQSLKIAVNNILTMMGVSVKSIGNKLPADTVTGCILLGRVFFRSAHGSGLVPIISPSECSVLISLRCSCPVTCFGCGISNPSMKQGWCYQYSHTVSVPLTSFSYVEILWWLNSSIFCVCLNV